MDELLVLIAGNSGLFTLDGTRTYVVGRERVAVVDPGPDDPSHLARVAARVESAASGTIVLTHAHPDHAGGARTLARRTGFPVAADDPRADRPLADGDRIPVDGGHLEAVATPGHARRHLAYLRIPQGDLFAGDLLLGEGETTWVGEYPGCVAEYLASLDRIRALAPRRILPGHGDPLDRPDRAVETFRAHRTERVRQLESLLRGEGWTPGRGLGEGIGPERLEALVDGVYGPGLPAGVREAARWSVRALLDHLGAVPFPPRGAPTEAGERLAPGS